MKTRTLDLVCHPLTHEPLQLAGARLLQGVASADTFAIRGGIPRLLPDGDRTGTNRRFQQLYDRIAPGYDLAERAWRFWKRLSALEMRRPFLKDVAVERGQKVLEVSVGTGANIWVLPADVEYYGLDISWGMLRCCQRNARRAGREVDLVWGSAEHLPFKDECFDCVFHVGGINFFSDKARAIGEMIRVAKPGTRIVIADEEEKHVKSHFERYPLIGRYFKNRKAPVSAPADLVPAEMHDLKVERVLGGRAYVMSFTKR